MQTEFLVGKENTGKQLNSEFVKKKILFLVPSLRIGGAEKVCASICDNIDYDKYNVFLVSLSNKTPLLNSLKNKSRITFLELNESSPPAFPWISIRSLIRLYKCIREIKPDIIHSHLWGTYCIYLYLFLFIRDKPTFISTIHSSGFIYTSDRLMDRISKSIENTIYKALNFNLVSISEEVNNMIKNRLYCKSINHITNGIDTDLFTNHKRLSLVKRELKLESAFPIIIHVGRASFEKRQEDIINSVPKILSYYSLTKVLLVGRDNSTKYSSLVKKLNLERHVLFLDERTDIPDLLSISTIGVFPSLYEGLPISLLEMMASGLPLVVSDLNVLKDITNNGKAAIYVSTNNPGEIADAILKILGDQKLRKDLSTNARIIACERFSLRNMILKYEDLYTSLQ